jgi:serine/threonine protein kinase
VAVKRLKVSSQQIEEDKDVYAGFLKEMSTMAQLTHENIVRVLALTQQPPPLIVLEFISGGSLYDWLRKAPRRPPLNILLVMAQQVSKGLSYLADRSVVHRDIAARNVLISVESQTKFVCKLTDFGLSRVFDNLTYKSNKTATPIPVRWTALEVSS